MVNNTKVSLMWGSFRLAPIMMIVPFYPEYLFKVENGFSKWRNHLQKNFMVSSIFHALRWFIYKHTFTCQNSSIRMYIKGMLTSDMQVETVNVYKQN